MSDLVFLRELPAFEVKKSRILVIDCDSSKDFCGDKPTGRVVVAEQDISQDHSPLLSRIPQLDNGRLVIPHPDTGNRATVLKHAHNAPIQGLDLFQKSNLFRWQLQVFTVDTLNKRVI